MSIIEVAKLAGVSHATVSRVLNNRPGVSVDSVHRVRRAMESLEYQPSSRRRGRRPKPSLTVKTDTVILLLLGMDISMIEAPVFAAMLHGAETALNRRHMHLQLAQCPQLQQLPVSVLSRRAGGHLLLGVEPPAALRRQIETAPTVWLGSRHSTEWGDAVQPDDERVGSMALDYLVRRGHKRLAYVNIEPAHPGHARRARQFRILAEDRGLIVQRLDGDDSQNKPPLRPFRDEREAAKLVDRLIAASPRATGIFVLGDMLAMIVQRLLERRGVKPGHDVELISVNNEAAFLAGLDPRPAAIDIRAELIGARAVDHLVWRMNNPYEPGRMRVLVEPILVEP